MAYLNDGHSTTIGFLTVSSPDPDAPIAFLFKEKRVTPIGVDGGGPNDTTTMRNTTWRTMQPKKLKTLTEMSATVSYDPVVMNPGGSVNVVDEINVNRQILVKFSDGSKLRFWGWLNNFTLGECAEGAQPEATISVFGSNQDNSGVEQEPIYTAAP